MKHPLAFLHSANARRPLRRQGAPRLSVETLEARRVLATLISGQVVNDLNGNGTIDSGEPGQAGVQVYVDSNANGTLDIIGRVLEPDDYAAGAVVDGSAAGVSLSVADPNNVPIPSAPAIVSRSDEFASTGDRVFGRDVGFFDHFFRLRIDFEAPVFSVQINFTGTRPFAGQGGRLEAYTSNGTLVGSYDTDQLLHNEYETMTVASSQANIAYATAFTRKEEQLTGRLDSLRVNGTASEPWTISDTSGSYLLSLNSGGMYPVTQVVPADHQQTLPANSAVHNVSVSTGQTVTDVNFANSIPNAGSWQNPHNALDVDDNGGIFPIDALLIINELNQPLYRDPVTGLLPAPPATIPAYYDVDGDGFAVPADAILVINYLNAQNRPVIAAEAEPMESAPQVSASLEVMPAAVDTGSLALHTVEPRQVDLLFDSPALSSLISSALASHKRR